MGVNRAGNSSALAQKRRFMGKNNRKKHEVKNTMLLSEKRSSLMRGKCLRCASILLSGEGAPQPLATHTHPAAGNRTRSAIFFL